MTEGSGRKCVLVLDDEYLVATEIADMLEDAGYEIAGPVLNVDEAARIVRCEDIDAAVLDIVLRGGTSLKLARTIGAHGIPVLLITGRAPEFADDEDWKSVPCLLKPFQHGELVQRVGLLVGNQAAEGA